MSTALDRRAEAAAAAVRAAVAHLEPVPGARPAPPRRRWPVLVAAVALVAAAIGGAVVVEGDDGDDVVAGPSGAIPRLVAGDLPAGVAPAGATELPVPGASSSTFRLYGRGDADDPFADGDVGVVIYRDVGPFTAPGKDVEVRGARGSLAEDASYGRSLTWHEAGVGSIGLQSRSMEEAQLHAVAEGLRRQGDDLVVDRPPDGYRLVADLRGLPGIATDAMAPGDRGSAVQYQSDHGDRSLTVTVVVDRPGALEAVRWLGGKGARSTSVRGHDGWLLPISAEEAQGAHQRPRMARAAGCPRRRLRPWRDREGAAGRRRVPAAGHRIGMGGAAPQRRGRRVLGRGHADPGRRDGVALRP
jgi:hypothetical protein